MLLVGVKQKILQDRMFARMWPVQLIVATTAYAKTISVFASLAGRVQRVVSLLVRTTVQDMAPAHSN